MVNSVDCVVAVGHTSGLVSIFQLPSVIHRTNNVVMIVVIVILLCHVPHIPYISSPNQCLLFAKHAHTIATCFTVVYV